MLSLAPLVIGTACAASHPARLLVCGSAQVLEGTIKQHRGKQIFSPQWYWRPEHSPGLPIVLMSKFVGTDECKPVENGRSLLVTSSAGALALVARDTGRTLFYASVINAHSAALLSGGLIVAASSSAPDGSGDRLLLFDRKIPDRVLASLPFVGAHGVEWDPARRVLWALNDSELAELSVANSAGEGTRLSLQRAFALPSRGGHDLVLAPDNSVLYLTSAKNVLVFHPNEQKFSAFAPLAGISDVKSLSIHPRTGRIVYTQAEPGVWWTYRLKFLGPKSDVVLPEHAYKARWDPAP